MLFVIHVLLFNTCQVMNVSKFSILVAGVSLAKMSPKWKRWFGSSVYVGGLLTGTFPE